ncbi:hypothetical protein [Massilia antarctica]|uniref:hypothetical protein n=1 Tax=Massilia antarctica TaxID=2765360 RepID=UPI002270C811|nr:hypothetical protein [Massilia sp. H27-R4]MCY0914040.1 hypothetical protein [Massilia sp. H27-R4]
MKDNSNVRLFPVQLTTDRVPPQHLMRASDYGLLHALFNLEEELGLVEAYNRLCDAAYALKVKIDNRA